LLDKPGRQTQVLEQVIAERVLDGFLRWQQQREDWSAQWFDGSGLATTTVYLTADELAEITREFEMMVRRYSDARPIGDAGARPADSMPVDLAYFAVPTGTPEPEA
jgi:hypothetical protein